MPHRKAIRAADQLTLKALREELEQQKADYEFAIRCQDHVIESQKLEIEHLKRYVFENGAKL